MNKTSLILFITLLFGSVLQAQDQKIGFIDSDIILQNIPEYSGIEQRLNLLSENWRQEIQEMEQEIEELERDFEAREILFTDDVRQQRLNQIDQLRQQRDNFVDDKFGPDGEYFQTQQGLLEPIQRQIFEALTRVATRDNYDFVFDRADETRFLFTRQEWNLTEKVMLEMGIDLDTARN